MGEVRRPQLSPQVDRQIQPIITAVSEVTEVREYDIRFSRKSSRYDQHAREYLRARRIACWVIRKLTDLSYPDFARHLGYSTHTGAIDAVKRSREMRDRESPRYDQRFDELCEEVMVAMMAGGGDDA